MNGKSKCKILKDIRRQIAQQNDIEYITSECQFQGNCSGTCPKCESEVRYLEEELRKRQQAGKAIAVAGIAAALVATASGCLPVQTGGDPLPDTTYSENQMIDGEMAPPAGAVPGPTQSTATEEMMGADLPPEDMGDILPPEDDPEADMGEIIGE